MKKVIQKEVEICDFCDKNEVFWSGACDNCGKKACRKCRMETFEEYGFSVYSNGSDDGKYCADDGKYCAGCHQALLDSGDELLAACRVIERLQREYTGFQADFNKRATEAQDIVRRLVDQRRRAEKIRAGLREGTI